MCYFVSNCSRIDISELILISEFAQYENISELNILTQKLIRVSKYQRATHCKNNQSKIDTTYQSLVDIRVFYVKVRYFIKIEFELPRVRTPPDLSITLFPIRRIFHQSLEHMFYASLYSIF